MPDTIMVERTEQVIVQGGDVAECHGAVHVRNNFEKSVPVIIRSCIGHGDVSPHVDPVTVRNVRDRCDFEYGRNR